MPKPLNARALAPLDADQAVSLSEQAYQNIKWGLILGDFRPGDAISIRKTADRMGCSMMPTVRGEQTGSKKRYAGLVRSNGEERLVFKGLESDVVRLDACIRNARSVLPRIARSGFKCARRRTLPSSSSCARNWRESQRNWRRRAWRPRRSRGSKSLPRRWIWTA